RRDRSRPGRRTYLRASNPERIGRAGAFRRKVKGSNGPYCVGSSPRSKADQASPEDRDERAGRSYREPIVGQWSPRTTAQTPQTATTAPATTETHDHPVSRRTAGSPNGNHEVSADQNRLASTIPTPVRARTAPTTRRPIRRVPASATTPATPTSPRARAAGATACPRSSSLTHGGTLTVGSITTSAQSTAELSTTTNAAMSSRASAATNSRRPGRDRALCDVVDRLRASSPVIAPPPVLGTSPRSPRPGARRPPCSGSPGLPRRGRSRQRYRRPPG